MQSKASERANCCFLYLVFLLSLIVDLLTLGEKWLFVTVCIWSLLEDNLALKSKMFYKNIVFFYVHCISIIVPNDQLI